ncbi:hypothetical protein HDV00_000709 [Rhizophlyctis rosea]|nr:hypothetical protein HDV00_000709 [Rhizophlyctis rosea]
MDPAIGWGAPLPLSSAGYWNTPPSPSNLPPLLPKAPYSGQLHLATSDMDYTDNLPPDPIVPPPADATFNSFPAQPDFGQFSNQRRDLAASQPQFVVQNNPSGALLGLGVESPSPASHAEGFGSGLWEDMTGAGNSTLSHGAVVSLSSNGFPSSGFLAQAAEYLTGMGATEAEILMSNPPPPTIQFDPHQVWKNVEVPANASNIDWMEYGAASDLPMVDDIPVQALPWEDPESADEDDEPIWELTPISASYSRSYAGRERSRSPRETERRRRRVEDANDDSKAYREDTLY